MIRFGATVMGLALVPAAAAAQSVGAPAMVVAVPPLATPKNDSTPEGYTGVLTRKLAEVIASDLRSSGDIVPVGPDDLKPYPFPEATAPSFSQWRSTTGAKALVTGFVQLRADGRLTVGCYLHDIAGARELARQGFAIAPAEWRRAAHRCSDMVYAKLTGRSGWFGARIAYVAESGPPMQRVKRIAVMDSDGSNHHFVTAGDVTVLTPHLSPAGDRLAYVSFSGNRPQVRLVDLASGDDRALLPDSPAMSFAPRFSPDGKQLLLSVASSGNTDLYAMDLASGGLRRLTFTPGIDTSASFSPDGSQVAFASDRSGAPQLYVMSADGSAARRISFGGGRYGAPTWSPDGTSIAFVRAGGDGTRIGTVNPDGSDEQLLTAGPRDESPSWSASSRQLLFQRGDPAGNGSRLFAVPLVAGSQPQPIATPLGASDPDWSSGGGK
jgi:TolB protein